MPRLLAIEAEPARRRALAALVREHVDAEFAIVGSVAEAIESLGERTPDLIVAPALLAPGDEADLLEHMKGLAAAPYIQMLTLPALDLLDDEQPAETRRRGLFRTKAERRQPAPGREYDRALVARQIADALRHAGELRMEYAQRLACDDAVESMLAPASVALAPADALPRASEAVVQAQLRERARDDRRHAPRKEPGAVEWLSAVRLSRGPELELVNISSTGVLVETGAHFPVGGTTHLHLCGPDTDLVVPVRFVRTDVRRVEASGVRYRVAAAFATEIDLAGPRRETGQPPSTLDALATLFRSVLTTLHKDPEPAHERFVRGLSRLVDADVRITSGTMATANGKATLYFEVPGDDPSGTVLQATFDHTHEVTDGEFRLLQAAAWLVATILELEKPISQPARRRGLMLLGTRVA